MGDLVEFKSRIAQACGEEPSPDFEVFLVEEGLDLLARFRSIKDATVRTSILEMVTKVADALRSDDLSDR